MASLQSTGVNTGHHRFSRQGFKRLHPGDSTNNIPMANVSSPAKSYQPPFPNNEKQGLHERPAANGYRRSIKPGMSPNGDQTAKGQRLEDEEGVMTKMGAFYERFRNFSVLTKYLVYIIPVGAILAVSIARPTTPSAVHVLMIECRSQSSSLPWLRPNRKSAVSRQSGSSRGCWSLGVVFGSLRSLLITFHTSSRPS